MGSPLGLSTLLFQLGREEEAKVLCREALGIARDVLTAESTGHAPPLLGLTRSPVTVGGWRVPPAVPGAGQQPVGDALTHSRGRARGGNDPGVCNSLIKGLAAFLSVFSVCGSTTRERLERDPTTTTLIPKWRTLFVVICVPFRIRLRRVISHLY